MKKVKGLSQFWNFMLWFGAILIVALPILCGVAATVAAILGVVWLWGLVF